MYGYVEELTDIIIIEEERDGGAFMIIIFLMRLENL